MDNPSKHIILKYLRGELSDSERFAFEKQMLDDPFLNDAVEGYQKLPTEEVDKILGSMESLTQSVGSTRTNWYWVAASILLIFTVSIIFMLPDDLTKEDSIALAPTEGETEHTEEKLMEPEVTPMKDEEQKVENTKEVMDVDSEPVQQLASPRPEPMETPEEDIADEMVAQDDDVIQDESTVVTAREEVAAQGAGEVEEVQPLAAPAVALQEDIEEKEAVQKKSTRIQSNRAKRSVASDAQGLVMASEAFSGKVTHNGQPIVGANIYAEEGPGIFSTSSGSFIWPFEEKELLIVKNGYQDHELNGLDNVEMIPAIKNEFEIQNSDRIFDQMPGPRGGRQSYLRYMIRNLRVPDTAKAAGVKGTVSLTADFDENGSLIAVTPIAELSHGCTEEAIRLVTDGPPWNPAVVDDRRVSFTVLINVVFE